MTRHIIIGVGILLSLFASHAHAKIFFQSGFEEVPIENGGWGYAQGWCFAPPMLSRQNPCPEMDTSTDYAYSGSRSLKQTYNAAWSDPNPQTHAQEIARVPHTGTLASAGQDLWVTYRYRTVGFTYTAASSTKQVYYKNYQNTAPTWVSNFYWGARELGMGVQGLADICPTNPSSGPLQSCNLYPNMTPVVLANDQWYCIEEHLHINTHGQKNGSAEIFVNGVQTLGYYNIKWLSDAPVASNAATGGCCNGWNMPTTVIDKVALYKQNGDGTRYWDDFIVSDTRIGCGGTIDTTPPEVPSAPTITSGTSLPVNLQWPPIANSAGDLGGYIVYRKLNEACSGGTVVNSIATLGIVTNYTDTQVPQGTTHACYKLASQDASGNVSALSSGVDQDIGTASGNAFVATWLTDTLGGQLTFQGAAHKIRYWTGANNSAKTEIAGLGGVTSYRLNLSWSYVHGGFACVEAAGSDGVYETVINPQSYICNTAPVALALAQLRIHPTNGRWLADVNDKAILLAGSGLNGCCTVRNLSRSAIQDAYIDPIVTTTYTDSFNRSNANPVGGTYTPQSGNSPLQIVSNTLRGTTANAVNAFVDSRSLPANQYSSIEVTGDSGTWTRSLRLKVRAQGENNYECLFSTDKSTFFEAKISRRTAGQLTDLRVETYSHGTGRYTARAMGTVIQCLKGTTVVVEYDTFADAVKYTSGNAGVGLFGNASADYSQFPLDNYESGEVVVTNDFTASLNQQLTNGSKLARFLIGERTAWGSSAQFAARNFGRIPIDQMPYCVTGTRTDTSTGVPVLVGIYDLTCLNQSFFDRLRARAIEAANAGMVPIINLFTGWQMSQSQFESFSNPFGKSANNVQGIGMDTNNDGKTEESHTLVNSTVTQIQRNYIAKVVASVCDVGPVLFEVSNEDMGQSGSEFTGIQAWQNMVVEQIKITNTDLGCVNSLVVRSMYGPSTGYHTDNDYLFDDSIGDIIAPGVVPGIDYVNAPPANDGTKKIVFYDLDHALPNTPDDWSWKSVMRAVYPVYIDEHWMDDDTVRTKQRLRLKGINEWGAKLKDLASMVPETDTDVISSGYALVNPCQEYLAYRPSEGTLSIDLTACSGDTFVVEAFNPATNQTISAGTVNGGGTENFNPTEWSGDFVIYLLNDSDLDTTAPAKPEGVTVE